MKFRSDFVTNSSSSCFICEICGEEASGYDLCLSDAGMSRCEHGHTFCDSHALDYDNKNVLISLIKNNLNYMKEHTNCYNESEIAEIEEFLVNIDSASESELRDFCDEQSIDTDEIPSEACPICTFNVLTNEMVAKYLMKEHNVKMPNLKREIMEKFQSYSDLEKYVKE